MLFQASTARGAAGNGGGQHGVGQSLRRILDGLRVARTALDGLVHHAVQRDAALMQLGVRGGVGAHGFVLRQADHAHRAVALAQQHGMAVQRIARGRAAVQQGDRRDDDDRPVGRSL
ncbi:hypothetical protein, partial [Achromobacter sp. DMS1]|uniref:hypothetical protein n=1 Tax=Achromobacter sp. DMS1 TaxID=1688405 RepID=UPI001364BC5A